MIGLFWYGHHVAWSRLERSSGKLVAANLLLLSLIGLMPFTTALIGGDYGGTDEAARGLGLRVQRRARRPRRLADGPDRDQGRPGDADRSRSSSGRNVVGGWLRVGIFFVSIPIAFLIDPTVAELIWLGLLFTIAARRTG